MKICVIPARGGSKRIPKKNIKDFNGKPVIAYPIKAALESELFDQVIVSTDDTEIAEIAQHYGAQVPFMRPEHLADDFAGTIPVLRHTYDWCQEQGWQVENLCNLYPVNPFVTSEIVCSAYQFWADSDFDMCMGVCEFESAPQRAMKINEFGALNWLYPEYANTRTQDLEAIYYDSGMFYFYKTASLFDKKFTKPFRAQPYRLPRHLVHDIDTKSDWEFAEKMFALVNDNN